MYDVVTAMPSGDVAGEQGLLPPKFLTVGKFSSCQKNHQKSIGKKFRKPGWTEHSKAVPECIL